MVSENDILNASILVVDDIEANVRLLKRTLRGAGYTAITSTMDPEKVCELHRKNHYDLILLDLEMPGMDGFEVMAGLKEIEADSYLPVIVVTAQPEHKLFALQAGAKDFISKPFDLIEVLTRAKNMIEVRLLHTEAKNHSKVLRQTLLQVEESHELIRRLNLSLQKHLVATDAMNEDLDSFTHSVSHDLRTPLRLTIKITHLLLQDYGGELPDVVREKIHMILQSSQEMGVLIEALLAFSRAGREPLVMKSLDLKKLADVALKELRAEPQCQNLKVVLDELPPCQADRALLKQVLLNLLANSLKFTRLCESAEIRVGTTQSNGETAYFVRDNGVGFGMEHAEFIFLPFYRLHQGSQFGGSGVGLALVKRIIERHGGRVWAESEIEHGATFYFTLGVKGVPVAW